jgi:hypothetical protein
MRYIELNPVRACMVEMPEEYKWSSYHANANQAEDEVIQNHPIYTRLGTTVGDRKKAYRELFRNYIGNEMIHEIRETLNHELVLGRSRFKDRIEEMTNRKARLGKPGRPSKRGRNPLPSLKLKGSKPFTQSNFQSIAVPPSAVLLSLPSQGVANAKEAKVLHTGNGCACCPAWSQP